MCMCDAMSERRGSASTVRAYVQREPENERVEKECVCVYLCGVVSMSRHILVKVTLCFNKRKNRMFVLYHYKLDLS